MSSDTDRPSVLLIHGTGAATHSWRGVMPLLATTFDVIAVDLPGHGFTSSPPTHGYSLPEMAYGLSELLKVIGVSPTIVIGHSAGAAILAHMCIQRFITPQHLVSVNGALLPLSGLAGEVFSPIAKVLSRSTLVPRLFAWRASDPAVLRRIIDATGSRIDDEGQLLYGAVIGNAGHAGAALEMMAQWDLHAFTRDLGKLNALPLTTTLVVADNDKTVSPGDAVRVRAILPMAQIVRMPGLGHLAHEESPDKFVEIVNNVAAPHQTDLPPRGYRIG
jgi:magnesium chelatase accessory protein